MRCCRAPKSRPFWPTTTSSPSSTTLSRRSFRNAGSSSGKYRVIGRAPRLMSSTLSPSRKTSVRKPSHLGSYSQLSPRGMPSPGADSIGSMSSGIGSFNTGIYPQFVYILWTNGPCATISPVGKAGSEFRLHAPTPALGSSRKRASRFSATRRKASGPEPLQKLRDGHVAIVLAKHGLGRVPDRLRLGGAAVGERGELDRAEQLDLRNLLQLLRRPARPLRGVALARTGAGSCGSRFGLADLGPLLGRGSLFGVIGHFLSAGRLQRAGDGLGLGHFLNCLFGLHGGLRLRL